MLGPFPFSGTHASRNNPSVGSATRARGYARHYLWNTSIFWSVVSLACISGLGYLFAQRPLKEETLFYAAASLLGVFLAYSFWRTSRALTDLMGEPVSFEGRVRPKPPISSGTNWLSWKRSIISESFAAWACAL